MFPERTSEAVVPFCDGCVNVWLWCCALNHLCFEWLLSHLLIWPWLSVCLFVCSPPPRRGPAKLSIAKVTQVDFPPKEVVSYTKETQTPTMSEQNESEFWPWKHSAPDVSLLPTCLPFRASHLALVDFQHQQLLSAVTRILLHFHTDFAIKTSSVVKPFN